MDLRGYGLSDKPPRGYDLGTTALDIAGLVLALGHTSATVVAHGDSVPASIASSHSTRRTRVKTSIFVPGTPSEVAIASRWALPLGFHAWASDASK